MSCTLNTVIHNCNKQTDLEREKQQQQQNVKNFRKIIKFYDLLNTIISHNLSMYFEIIFVLQQKRINSHQIFFSFQCKLKKTNYNLT